MKEILNIKSIKKDFVEIGKEFRRIIEYSHTTDPMYYWSTQTIVYLLRAYGYKYNWAEPEMAREAKNIASPETVPWWPEKEGIIKCDGYWIVKINPF